MQRQEINSGVYIVCSECGQFKYLFFLQLQLVSRFIVSIT